MSHIKYFYFCFLAGVAVVGGGDVHLFYFNMSEGVNVIYLINFNICAVSRE